MSYEISSSRARSLSLSHESLGQKLADEPVTLKNAQSSVTCIYVTHIGGYWHNVMMLWSKNLMNYSFTISVDSMGSDYNYSCKVDLKPWHFWSKKGFKSFDVDGNEVKVYWDLQAAKFSGGPEPSSDFCVALVSEEEVVLLLGDYKKKAYKRTKSRPALVEAKLFYKKEHVFNKKSFSARAKFDQTVKEHEIVVESATSGPRDPEMWISIDGIVAIHIRNLQWKFRGNQTVLVNKLTIQVYWDVHAWLFCTPGSGHGLFIFKAGAPEPEGDKEENSQSDSESDNSSSNSGYYSVVSHSKDSHFCLFLYAWKLE